MLVYRYQNERGLGPYYNPEPDSFNREICNFHNNCSKHPHPGQDKLLYELPFQFTSAITTNFGFHAFPLLIKWFDRFHRKLYKNNFKIHIFNIPDNSVKIGESNLQCVFIKNHAKLIKIIENYTDFIEFKLIYRQIKTVDKHIKYDYNYIDEQRSAIFNLMIKKENRK